MSNDFNFDLQNKGIPTEEKALQIIRRRDKSAYRVVGKDSGKDIIAPRLNQSFEVKWCGDAVIYVVIETGVQRGEEEFLSGLSVTTADFWIIFCKNKFYFIEVEILKELVKDRPQGVQRIYGQNMIIKHLDIDQLNAYAKHIYTR